MAKQAKNEYFAQMVQKHDLYSPVYKLTSKFGFKNLKFFPIFFTKVWSLHVRENFYLALVENHVHEDEKNQAGNWMSSPDQAPIVICLMTKDWVKWSEFQEALSIFFTKKYAIQFERRLIWTLILMTKHHFNSKRNVFASKFLQSIKMSTFILMSNQVLSGEFISFLYEKLSPLSKETWTEYSSKQ